MIRWKRNEDRDEWRRLEYTERLLIDAVSAKDIAFTNLISRARDSSDPQAAKAAVLYVEAVKLVALLGEK